MANIKNIWFRRYLTKKLGLSTTRSTLLAESIEALHRVICYMDDDNFDVLKKVGIPELLAKYGQTEDLKIIALNKAVELKKEMGEYEK